MKEAARGWKIFALVVAGVIFGVMQASIADTPTWQESPQGMEDQAAILDAIVGGVFGPQVIAFEVLGILLTAAMIGALVIARPLDAVEDQSHYADIPEDLLESAQHVSDLDAMFQPPAPLILEEEE